MHLHSLRHQCPFQNPPLTHFPSLAPVAPDGKQAKRKEMERDKYPKCTLNLNLQTCQNRANGIVGNENNAEKIAVIEMNTEFHSQTRRREKKT